MKIRISDISPQGLKINDSLPLEALNSRMQEGQDKDIVFLVAPEVSLTVTRIPGGANISGTISSRYRQSCSRCLDPIERDLEVEFTLALQPAGSADPDDSLQDIGILYYTDETVNIEEALQENIILSLSRFWHPPLKPDGSCTLCGLKAVGQCSASSESSKPSMAMLLDEARRKAEKI